MAGTEPVATLTREHRDALHREIREYELAAPGQLGDFAGYLQGGDGAGARESWQRAARAARLLDDLGWDIEADRDTYAITMNRGDLECLIRHRLEQIEACLREHAQTLAEAGAGRDPWARYRHLGAPPLEEELAEVRSYVDRDLDVVAACHAVLEQLGAA